MATGYAEVVGQPETGRALVPMEIDPEERERQMLEAGRAILGRLEGLAQEQVSAKSSIETRWLKDLSAYHGKYEKTELKEFEDAERSTAFVGLTRAKTNGWAARLSDLLFPTDDRNWGIQPTPLPKLAQAAKEAMEAAGKTVEAANATSQAGDVQAARMMAAQADAFTIAAKRSDEEMEEAKRRTERMQAAIEDQLVEADYSAQCRQVIEDGCRIGTGILKGPLTSRRLRSEWRQGPGGWALVQIPDPMPEFVRVDPWHFFPDMSARSIREAEFSFERSLPTKKDLRVFAKKLGFNKAAVRRLLKEGPGDSAKPELSYITDLRSITDEGDPITNRYVMWEYHGPLECEEVVKLLRASGQDEVADLYEAEKDPLDEQRVIIWFCRGEVLRIAEEYPLDSGAPLYSVWNFEKAETSMFGYGLPHMMYDDQRAINSAFRMMMDNAGLSVGPQIVIDKNAITPQDNSYDIKPMKVWLKSTTSHHSPTNNPFEIHDIPNNQNLLVGIIETARTLANEETSSPTVDQGDVGQPTQTLGGMSMLMNSMNVNKRRVVKSFDDDLTKPTLRRAYDWNMQHNPDQTIKGDMQVEARGTSVLLMREIQSMHMMNITQNWPNNPALAPWMKVREAAVKTLQTLMIQPKDILLTVEEKEANDKKLAEQAAQAAGGAEAPPPDNRLEIARMDNETKRYVAEVERDRAMAELAVRERLGIEEVKAKFGIKREEIASRERTKAVEVAIEQERGAVAQAEGLPASAGTGEGVG